LTRTTNPWLILVLVCVAMFFFNSLYVQRVLGYSPIQAGLAFLPVTAGIVVGAGLSQVLIRRLDLRTIGTIGLSRGTVGMLLLLRLGVGGSYVGDLLPALIPLSIGMGLTFVPLTLIATSGVDRGDAGLASGLLNTSQQVGGALGLAILSTLAANRITGTTTTSRAPAATDLRHHSGFCRQRSLSRESNLGPFSSRSM